MSVKDMLAGYIDYDTKEDFFKDGRKPESCNDNIVSHPSHYTSGKIECIDFIQDKELNFCKGNVIKYVVRAGKKSKDTELQDLKKARQYLDFEIKRLEK